MNYTLLILLSIFSYNAIQFILYGGFDFIKGKSLFYMIFSIGLIVMLNKVKIMIRNIDEISNEMKSKMIRQAIRVLRLKKGKITPK